MTHECNLPSSVINIAAYRFVALHDLPVLRERLRRCCRQASLKGTILLSPEGINLFVAGARAGIDRLLGKLHEIDGLADLECKESRSDTQPFGKMLVKIKREIIPFGISEIAPAQQTSPKLSPQTLKTWLNAGEDVTLLDVRNDFEIEHGTFAGARSIGVPHFRHFPEAAAELPDDLKQERVVMFCTGGIRCEKAGPYLEQQGFGEVYQLDGGILKYFAECGGDHFLGNCFVFDERVALDSQLRPKIEGPGIV